MDAVYRRRRGSGDERGVTLTFYARKPPILAHRDRLFPDPGRSLINSVGNVLIVFARAVVTGSPVRFSAFWPNGRAKAGYSTPIDGIGGGPSACPMLSNHLKKGMIDSLSTSSMPPSTSIILLFSIFLTSCFEKIRYKAPESPIVSTI